MWCEREFTNWGIDHLIPSSQSSVSKHSNTIASTSKNTLLNHVLSNDNLDQALDWLRHSAREQDNSDVWHYSQHWVEHKRSLITRITSNSFEFQAVHDHESIDTSAAKPVLQVRELRCAEDRLLIRAISQILTPIVQAVTPTECKNLANRRSLKGATRNPYTTTYRVGRIRYAIRHLYPITQGHVGWHCVYPTYDSSGHLFNSVG